MAEWVERKISDIGTVVGGATPSTKKLENYEGGKIAWITPKDLSTFSGRYIERGERNITEIGLKSCSTQLLPPNTVLFILLLRAILSSNAFNILAILNCSEIDGKHISMFFTTSI